MGNLVIVAIPREDDPVWKISSEKVPHMTILFLGSGQNPKLTQIGQFLTHAANTSLTRFGLDVDRRGELGVDKADVLFFQDNWEVPRLREFRSQLLKDDNIRTAYDSVAQFDEWNPHLTLGFPDKPAKPTTERIFWVQFDRIALWDKDSEGLEIVLKRDDLMEVMMSDRAAQGRQFLSHFGIKGMRWGQRNAGSSGSGATAKDVRVHGVVNSGLRSKTKVKAKGGQAHPAVEEAIKVAGHKQVLKKSGPSALTNKELQDVITRSNLESQARAAATTGAKKFVKGVVKSEGQQQVRSVVSEAANAATEKAKKH